MEQESKQAAPLIKWKTTGHRIERVECLRETDQSVFLMNKGFMANKSGERREAKVSSWHKYHDSWDAAHTYLTDKAQGEVEDARRALERAKGRLGQIKGMKPPKDAA